MATKMIIVGINESKKLLVNGTKIILVAIYLFLLVLCTDLEAHHVWLERLQKIFLSVPPNHKSMIHDPILNRNLNLNPVAVFFTQNG